MQSETKPAGISDFNPLDKDKTELCLKPASVKTKEMPYSKDETGTTKGINQIIKTVCQCLWKDFAKKKKKKKKKKENQTNAFVSIQWVFLCVERLFCEIHPQRNTSRIVHL